MRSTERLQQAEARYRAATESGGRYEARENGPVMRAVTAEIRLTDQKRGGGETASASGQVNHGRLASGYFFITGRYPHGLSLHLPTVESAKIPHKNSPRARRRFS